ncbi:MAG: dTDP-glucose 4,6-dehydratase [Gammaproteobacteria bacterium]|nr:MAG: dTDP-glucose 4,6-dehydratase [Gammaproteobacteria bacterium]
MYKAKNILVTGAAGFIGSHFVKMMLSQYDDIKIISYDKLTYAGNLANLSSVKSIENHVFVQGDIIDEKCIYNILREHQIDTIVHFAAESHVDNSIDGPKIFFQSNVMGTFNLLQQAKAYWLDEKKWTDSKCRFHHISTDEVYGSLSKDAEAFTEKTAYQPNSPYSASKAGSDHIVRSYFHTYRLPVTTSNCSNNYGSYQHQEKLIPVVINSCIKQLPIPVYGDGSNIRDWLYVKDHCKAIDCIIQKGKLGEVYNIGGNNEISNIALVKMICRLMDQYRSEHQPHERLISFVDDRKGHDWRYAINYSKLYNELGWSPSEDFETMFKETIEFYLERV